MRSLCSSSSHQLSVPLHNLSFGSRAFRFSAPRVWNSLPVSIRESHSLPTFRRNLDILLSVSLPHFSCPPCLEYLCPRALILLRLRRYINHLLTYLNIVFVNELLKTIGVARGCSGCTCTPRAAKIFFRPNLQEKCVSAPPGHEVHPQDTKCTPQPEQESIFRTVFAG